MNKKAKKKFGDATRAGVSREIAKPRMAKSARNEESKRSASRFLLSQMKGSVSIARVKETALRDRFQNTRKTTAKKH
jgi:hypothetical protein